METQVKVISLEKSEVSEIIEMGLVGANYWADRIWVNGNEGKEIVQGLLDGDVISLETSRGEVVDFTLEDLKNGVGKALTNEEAYNHTYLDAIEADLILQYAIFGEMVYG